MTTRTHDPETCQDGDGCKPCKLADQRAQLEALTKSSAVVGTARIERGATSRALDVLREQAKRTRGRLAPPAGPALTLVLACALLVGCVAPEAIVQARTEAALNHGHAADTSLPLEARQIGADNSRAWQAQHVALTGNPVPGSESWPALEGDLAPAGSPR